MSYDDAVAHVLAMCAASFIYFLILRYPSALCKRSFPWEFLQQRRHYQLFRFVFFAADKQLLTVKASAVPVIAYNSTADGRANQKKKYFGFSVFA